MWWSKCRLCVCCCSAVGESPGAARRLPQLSRSGLWQPPRAGGSCEAVQACAHLRALRSGQLIPLSRSLSCLFRSLTCQKKWGVWVASSYYFFRTLIYWEFLLFGTFFIILDFLKLTLLFLFNFFYNELFIMNFLDRLKILIMIDTVATKPYPNLLHPCLT